MDSQQTAVEETRREIADQDETHEAAMRIALEREEKDRRLREVARNSVKAVPHELHTSIGE